MAKIYYRMVISGMKKWNEIPKTWRAKAIELLENDGYTLNDDGTVTKDEE
jgi:hypothetical protein